jgi:hypothetical protein
MTAWLIQKAADARSPACYILSGTHRDGAVRFVPLHAARALLLRFVAASIRKGFPS